jgi:recombination protein RecT
MGQELTVVQSVRQTLDRMQPELRAVLPAHIEAPAFTRVSQTAIQMNPDLQQCTTRSLVAACTRLAEIGLQPDGIDAAIVAYNVKVSKRGEPDRWEKQAKAMPMVAGIRDLVRRSGMVREWKVRLVYSQDHFRHIDGDVETLEHIPEYVDGDRIVKVYAIAYDNDGRVMSRHVMRIEAVEKIRRRSRSPENGPWVTDYEEMVKKTALRQHSKALPKAKDDLQRERFMGAIRALDEAEDVLALDRGPVAAALPAMSVQDAARRRLAEAVESSALDDDGGRQEVHGLPDDHITPPPPPAAPKVPRKRKTADERLAEANAGKVGNGRPASAAAAQSTASPKGKIEIISQEGLTVETREFLPHDEGRDFTYEDEQRAAVESENPEPSGFRDQAEPMADDEEDPEVQAYRQGWHTRLAGQVRVPPRTLDIGAEVECWFAGYDAAQKTVDIGNAPRDQNASEAILSRAIDRHFA